MLAAASFQKLPGFDLGEARVARLNRQKETVVSHPAEPVPVKHWMVRPRQAIHDQHGEKRGERREKNRQLEHDREKRGHGEKICGLTVNHERIEDRRWAELENYSRAQTGNSTGQNYGAEPRFPEAH